MWGGVKMLMNYSTRRTLGRQIPNLNEIWWSNRFARTTVGQCGVCPAGGSPKTCMRVKTVPIFSSGIITDANRDWTTPFQNVVVKFDAKMQDPALVVNGTATGHTISINGIAQTTKYISGSGFNEWTFQIPILVHQADLVTWSYNASIGATVTVMDGTELATVSNVSIANDLTKYIRFTLCNALDNLVANETIKIAISSYAGGVATAVAWLSKQQYGTVTTDVNGLVFFVYTGANNSGDTVYVTVIRPDTSPTESMVWTTIVQ
jgi:hypothetical protein